jgi:hypothetical protein
MKKNCFVYLLILVSLINQASAVSIVKTDSVGTNLIEISQQLLLAAKTKEPTDSLVTILQNIPQTELQKQIVSDDQKKAFWINMYNAFTQIILSKNPDQYKNRNSFFGSKQIIIASKKLSLDDIEHGILRHSKIKWSLGYFDKLFPGKFEKNNRVDKVDYRIHFALNCGAKSCPPIAFYKPEQINKQLDVATQVYLKGESEFKENKMYVPALMGWFRRDFVGKKKMKLLLRKLSIIPADKNPSIHFKKYDWNLFLENYKNE